MAFSSNLVFDGARATPYVERDAPRPLSAYGRTKAEGETLVVGALPSALIVRTSAFFGPWDWSNFVTATLAALRRGERVLVPADEVVSPTYVPDLVHAVLDLLVDGEAGIWHLANEGDVTWAEFGRLAALEAGVATERLVECAGEELGRPATRPPYSALASERGRLLGPLDDALARYVAAPSAST